MNEFQDVRTEKHLLQRLAIVAPREMSPEEKREQRISWIFGQLDGAVSKEEISKTLDKQEGSGK